MHIFRKKVAQDFQGYYAGDVPDYAAEALGTSMVDASQIKSMFGRVDDAVNLVNRFDGSLLQNVSFIFNFSKGGAYGVYLPALDRAIKNKALLKELERNGYEAQIDDKGLITARSINEQKTSEQIQQDIEQLKQRIDSQGGTAFGINMNDVLNSARQDAIESQSQDPNLWEYMAILHLGATIVHEAVHAKGNEGEGPSEGAENNFMNWAMPIVNEEYRKSLEAQGKEEMFGELEMSGEKRSAMGLSWYKTAQAQMSYYFPQPYYSSPSGSDLDGRYPVGLQSDTKMNGGMAGWSMIDQQDQSIPIEKRLGRQYMSPLPDDLNQERDSIEEQLRKYTRSDQKLDPNATMEELLSEGHDKNRGYYTLEELLNEKRTKPLLLPLNKAASAISNIKLTKTATLFGWMNNLEISDGNTIPGLSDRVMAWDDAEEDFRSEEEENKHQTRYNPEYDIKDFYMRYIEPRNAPSLWSSPGQDTANTHPAKRFAQTEGDDNSKNKDVIQILKILSQIRSKIRRGKIKSTRLVMTEDVLFLVHHLFGDSSTIKTYAFPLGQQNDGERVFSIWIAINDISPEDIQNAERFFENGEGNQELVENLIGYSEHKEKVIKEVLSVAKDICTEYGVKDVYIVGGYPRDIVMGRKVAEMDDLDFSGAWPNQCVKVGGLLAERFGDSDVKFFHRTMTLSFEHKGVKLDFRGNFSPADIRKRLRDMHIPTTPLNLDIYNRDFTINMLIYNILNGKIYDISGESIKDIKGGLIRTFFSPEFICRENPLVILRALKFKLRYGFIIDPELEKAMINNANRLFDGKYSDSRLIFARESIVREGRGKADKLFEEYGLDNIKEI